MDVLLMSLPAFEILAFISIGFLLLLLYLALFEPGLRFRVQAPPPTPLQSDDFRRMLSAVTNATIHEGNRVDVLPNGEVFYEAELEAISNARHSVNIEVYIFQKGRVAARFIDALAERARAGVKVNLVIDAIGSFATWDSYLAPLREAGAQVERYHPIRWYTLPRVNNRTHRSMIIVDGRIGFIGGAGIADHWLYGRRKSRRWRDTMFRVEGNAVNDLQSTFVENWLEASGDILASIDYFPASPPAGSAKAMIIDSSPSAGASSRARILFQTLLGSARETIHINTPYFLPDRSARAEMIRAMTVRGVKIAIITPGRQSDHLLTRTSSQRLYGSLLKAGARIYEYRPAMMHAKILIVDGIWSVVGSTNFDNRSFGLNDEVNLAVADSELAARLLHDFDSDLAESDDITYENWRRRSFFGRAHEWLGWILERQQ
jgi:cardiolipin synthase